MKNTPLKIGILQCDDALEEFQPEFGTYPSMIKNLLNAVSEPIQFNVYDVRNKQYPQQIDDHDAYITTGSRHGVNDDLPWIESFLDFIQKLHRNQKKLIGICFGHQAIAKALGGKVAVSDNGWGIGLSINYRVMEKAWMTPPCDPLKVIVSHKEQVVILPENAELLYSSDFCPNYMMAIGSHFMSLQGHPEFCAGYSSTLMGHRRGIIPDAVIDRGLDSLREASDSPLIAQWIIQFIQSA